MSTSEADVFRPGGFRHVPAVAPAEPEALEALAGGIAHHVNNLMTVVLWCTDLLAMRSKDGVTSRDVEPIRKAARRAASLAQELLAFARRQPLFPEVVDLNVLVALMRERLRLAAGDGIEVRTVLGEGPEPVRVDPEQMKRVMLELVENARDAMPDGGALAIETARVSVGAQRGAADGSIVSGEYVQLSVSDTGCGMDPRVLGQAFDPFFTTKEDAAGLGLAAVAGIVAQSGGQVGAASRPGLGTTVTIYLPPAERSVAADAHPGPRHAPFTEGVEERTASGE